MTIFKRGKEALYELEIREELSTFLNLHDYTQVQINRDRSAISKKIEDFIAKYSEEAMDDQQEIEFEREIDNMVDDLYPYSRYYPDIVRKSLLISIWSFYEHQLIKFCRKKDPKKIFKNSIVDNAKGYIKKEMNLKFPDQGKDWIFLMNVKEVRNCLVHEGGYVDDNPRLENIIRHLNNVSISPNDEIILKNNFIEELVEHVNNNLYCLFIETEYP